MIEHAKTVICDIDGTIFAHLGDFEGMQKYETILLDKVKERFDEWYSKGYMIIITTGRPWSLYERTMADLSKFKLPFEHLIMGTPWGERVVINDGACSAIQVKCDGGLGEVNI